MKTLEYSDFYKFIASIGVVLISIAVLFPWLLLQEPFDVALKTSDITTLTYEAQVIIAMRQTTALWLLSNVRYISGVLAITGVIFLGAGLFNWFKMQKIRDEREFYETEKVRRELEPMSAEQIARKAIEDVAEKDTEEKQFSENQPIPDALVPSTNSVVQYFYIEKMVQDKLRSCLGNDGDVLQNQQIKSAEYDVVFMSKKEDLPDVIFEIKYARRGFRLNWVRESVNRLILATDIYFRTMRREARSVVFFISPKSTLTNIPTDTYKDQVIEESKRLGAQPTVLFIPEEEWGLLDCKKLRSMIFTEKSEK